MERSQLRDKLDDVRADIILEYTPAAQLAEMGVKCALDITNAMHIGGERMSRRGLQPANAGAVKNQDAYPRGPETPTCPEHAHEPVDCPIDRVRFGCRLIQHTS